MKTCSMCKEEKSRSEFYKNKSRKDGLSYRCKPCQKSYVDPEKKKIYLRQYNKENSAKIKKYYQDKKHPCQISGCKKLIWHTNDLCNPHSIIKAKHSSFSNKDIENYIVPTGKLNRNLIIWQNKVRYKYQYKCCGCGSEDGPAPFSIVLRTAEPKRHQKVELGRLFCRGCIDKFILEEKKLCIKCDNMQTLKDFSFRTDIKKYNNRCKTCVAAEKLEKYLAARKPCALGGCDNIISSQAALCKPHACLKNHHPEFSDEELINWKKTKVIGWDLYKWANAVKARDNNECQDCGSAEELEAHHIKLKSKFPELMLDMDNGMTYCKDCHNDTHAAVT